MRNFCLIDIEIYLQNSNNILNVAGQDSLKMKNNLYFDYLKTILESISNLNIIFYDGMNFVSDSNLKKHVCTKNYVA